MALLESYIFEVHVQKVVIVSALALTLHTWVPDRTDLVGRFLPTGRPPDRHGWLVGKSNFDWTSFMDSPIAFGGLQVQKNC